MSKEDEKKNSSITNIYISDSVINRSSIGNEKEDSKVESSFSFPILLRFMTLSEM
jgi:hypothetical protein